MSVELHAEFRSPRHRTFLLPAFWDGGRRMVIRFAPTEPGDWIYRVTSNIARFNGGTGELKATDSGSPGYIKPANVHHFSYLENFKPHLWMGDTCFRFGFIDRAQFDKLVDTRAAQKFNHMRGLVLGWRDDAAKAFPKPDQPAPEYFREFDQRISLMNGKGIVADLILAADRNHLTEMFPAWQQRERYVRYLTARYSAMNITWQGVEEFESYENGRATMKEVGLLLKKLDPYQHPRSSAARTTSAPLQEDGWQDFILDRSPDAAVGAIEHQLNATPQVNAGFAYEDSGAGKSHPAAVDADTFRKRLWNAAMNGQYVTFGNTGTLSLQGSTFDAKHLDSPAARQMTAFYDFFSRTRHWDLEPYFDVDGGRAVALESIEYIVYLEKPGQVEIAIEKHDYNVAWFNPITGEYVKQKKDFKGEKFVGEPPSGAHDWVLHLSRESKKESMLRSYKFEARRIVLQEVDQDPKKIPFEIEQPAADTFAIASPPAYAVKLKRETRATRSMLYLWTGEVAADGRGFRVLGTGPKGTLAVPPEVVVNFPAVLHLRLTAMNANGKVYSTDRICHLTR